MSEHLLVGLATIIVLGVGAQWLAWRLRLPSILLLLVFGFLAGPVAGFIDPDEIFGQLLFPIVSISVAVILFEGGLTLRLGELPHIGDVVFRLISVGALVTWGIAAVAARFILALDWSLSVLLGAILVVTGPTVIGPLLRQIRPKGQVGTVLKWEGILIDPVGAVLAVLVFEAILAGEFSQAPSVVAAGVLLTIVIGLGFGLIGAAVMVVMLRQYWIPDHLQNSVSLLLAVAVFALSNLLQPESGLLSVTVMGVALANQRFVSIRHIIEFKENLRVLLIGTLFILLAGRLELSDVSGLGWGGVLFLAILILLARPAAVLISTWRSRLNRSQRLFLTWMAPRGIVAASVASIFAFELAAAGHEGADRLLPLTFLVIVGSVAFYGLSAGPAARRLGLAEEDPQGVLIIGAHALARAIAGVIQEHGFDALLIDSNWQNIRASRMAGLKTHYGDVLAEDVIEDLELTGIGRLLAMTSNNEVNSLAALHFPEVFSRAEVYQLPMGEGRSGNEDTPQHLTGRFLFGPKMTYNRLMQEFASGAVVKATSLTQKFDYAAFRGRYDDDKVIPLFLITERQKLKIYTTDNQPAPEPGQTLISLVHPAEASVEEAGSVSALPRIPG